MKIKKHTKNERKTSEEPQERDARKSCRYDKRDNSDTQHAMVLVRV